MIDWILQNGLTILALGGYVLAGVFAFGGLMDRQSKSRNKESDDLADTLINRLKQTVEQQTKDIEKMDQNFKTQSIKRDSEIMKLQTDLSHLQGRNAVLEDLFKGRDPAMQAFLKEAPDMIAGVRENNQLVKGTVTAVKEMAEAVKSLVARIDAHPESALETHAIQ